MFCVTCYMAEIVPAIIAKDFAELERKIKLVEPYVNWVQLDVMDGKFAPEKSWPYTAVIPAKAGIQSVDSRLRGNDKGGDGGGEAENIGCLDRKSVV